MSLSNIRKKAKQKPPRIGVMVVVEWVRLLLQQVQTSQFLF